MNKLFSFYLKFYIIWLRVAKLNNINFIFYIGFYFLRALNYCIAVTVLSLIYDDVNNIDNKNYGNFLYNF